MVESIYTVEFLNSLSNELKSQLKDNLKVEREYRVALRGDKSQGFIYDIGIISKNNERLILIEIELGGKTPIYNLMKTVYWHTLSKVKPGHVLFLHIFSTDPKSKNRHVPEDMTEFTKQLFIKDMFDYRHINFSQ